MGSNRLFSGILVEMKESCSCATKQMFSTGRILGPYNGSAAAGTRNILPFVVQECSTFVCVLRETYCRAVEESPNIL